MDEFVSGEGLVKELILIALESDILRKRRVSWCGGAISYNSRSQLVFIEGSLNARRYVNNILRPVAIPFLSHINGAIFQQDNALPHTANISRASLRQIELLPWPARSPDLSPIEHVWDIIGRRLRAASQSVQNIAQLRGQIGQAWSDIPQDEIRNLFDSMPRRVSACISENGGHTTY